MKQSKLLAIIILLCLNTQSKLNSATEYNRINSLITTSIDGDDTNLKLAFTKLDWRIDVQVSFDGDEGKTGKLKIYNSKDQAISQFDILLKKSPDFYSVNLNEYASDNYTFELTTEKGIVHTSHLNIK